MLIASTFHEICAHFWSNLRLQDIVQYHINLSIHKILCNILWIKNVNIAQGCLLLPVVCSKHSGSAVWMYVDKSALVVFRAVFFPCVAAKPATAVESIVLNKTFSAAKEYCSHLMLSTSLSVILRGGLDASTLTQWSSIHSKFSLPWVDLSQRH